MKELFVHLVGPLGLVLCNCERERERERSLDEGKRVIDVIDGGDIVVHECVENILAQNDQIYIYIYKYK